MSVRDTYSNITNCVATLPSSLLRYVTLSFQNESHMDSVKFSIPNVLVQPFLSPQKSTSDQGRAPRYPGSREVNILGPLWAAS